jgi:sec-independent protein translocase protein TatB
MFGIGTTEILVILLIALLILGPKEIPKIARTLGRTMREFQRAKDELRHTINSEIDDEEENIKPLENKTEEKKVAEGNKSSNTDGETKKEEPS